MLAATNRGGGGFSSPGPADSPFGRGGDGITLNWGEGAIELSAGGRGSSNSTQTQKTGYGCGENANDSQSAQQPGTVLVRYAQPGHYVHTLDDNPTSLN